MKTYFYIFLFFIAAATAMFFAARTSTPVKFVASEGEIVFVEAESGWVGTVKNKTRSLVSNKASISVSAPDKKAPPEITILMGGDVMFDRSMRKVGYQNGFDSLLSGVAPLFQSADISIVNLEGPITTNPSKTLLPDGTTSNLLSFTFPPEAADVLYRAGIDAVSLANNHTDNFGLSGLEDTKAFLNGAGVKFFGDPWNSKDNEFTTTIDGIKVAFVGYHSFQTGYPNVLDSIKRLSDEGYFVIVMPHWGEEYVTTASPALKKKAAEMISAGADAIIGAHPHVTLNSEWIEGVPVIYSLGNLLFDQYFSQEVMKGHIVELKLVKEELGVKVKSIGLYQTSLESKAGVSVASEYKEIQK